jgi:exopolyphosphatase/guanosine-5'-triphosphate,3'-diphosphate pyrophosphatase
VTQPLRDHTPTSAPPVAVIDIGSNSICLLVVRLRHDGTLEILSKIKDDAQLRAQVGPEGRLSSAGVDRMLAVLARFQTEIARLHAEPYAVATAALRASTNARQVVLRIKEEVGLDVHVISGHEEARLAWLGARHAMGHAADDGQILCVDVGGGSTELLLGRRDRAVWASSLPLGAIVVARDLLGPDPVTAKAFAHARHEIREQLQDLAAELRHVGAYRTFATSGTVQRVARIALGLRGEDPRDDVHGFELEASHVHEVVEKLAATRSTAERKAILGMDPSRADTLLGGAMLHEALSEVLHIERWTVSMAGLRMGLVAQALAARGHREPPHGKLG